MKIAIVISSCDEYSDSWKPMFFSLKTFWSDCPYPIYLISNYKDSKSEFIKTIKIGEHLGWGTNTRKALEKLDVDYLIYLQEDYFLTSNVDTENIFKYLEYCKTNQIDYLRLGYPFRDNNRIGSSDYCNDPLTCKYALSLQPSIWNKKKLLELCIDGFTGWDYERKIAKYINKMNLSVTSQVLFSSVAKERGFPMLQGTAIRKGKWTRRAKDYLQTYSFYEELRGREVEGRLLTFLIKIHKYYILRLPVSILIRLLQK